MREYLNGAQAIVRAAIDAECNFFAGYPITPASGILAGMLEYLPAVVGIGVQAEDEIASMGFCIAASMTGRKVMTATSGPGISLYSENIGLAIMGEVPIVIVNTQRMGPATGGATTGAEGDVLFTRWVTSGGYPTIILSPTDIADSYLLTIHAFNYAEKYRTPVFLLTSKELVFTMETAELDKIIKPVLIKRKHADPDKSFIPYAIDKLTDIPAISHYGESNIVRFTTSMHDERAFLTKDIEKIDKKLRHLEYKINAVVDDITIVEEAQFEEAKTLVISYGVTARSVRDALQMARDNGKIFSSLIIKSLYPVPESVIRKAVEKVECVVVPELNMGQYVREIRQLAPAKEIIPVNRVDGELISPETILERVRFA
ncbi:MAG: hypothetical protein A2161_16640 [Candidatus Schekmanbacteria bacterium RBG_13_48_7]|uniref:Pyruvate flavodoxin/ferredoxin oxidoreductase n=1 Tax=Candidatus Schekmanbacteria bacterium RBG_13_48_7 TaxID=1817878 RepID=A0A1F7RZE7_9BACT|nr:MAG: hypothetical protein A2161_16640 [Candidatus Schekmanbacteria bacterium RBG_13_48_7]